jgi:hypothetical protein
MNHDLLIKTTNRVAVYATAALFYWIFAFLTITVFDLKIFREKMTEMYFLSLLGIFALLGGAIILNVMSNLSKISASVSRAPAAEVNPEGRRPWRLALVLISFPLIAAALFAGDNLSAQRKEKFLVASAEKFIVENQSTLATLADYKFSPEFVETSSKALNILNKIDKNFPEVMVIFPDSIDDKALFLGFDGRQYTHDDSDKEEKVMYIHSTAKDEREFLSKFFAGTKVAYKFEAKNGNYQLYFPTTAGGRKIVLYFSDNQRYGKLGS